MTIAPLMIDLEGCELTPEERELIEHPYVGSIILFTRNYENPRQVSALTQAIRQTKKKSILIAVDQEGGRVQRFRAPLTELPPAAYFGECYAKSPSMAMTQAEKTGQCMASELRALGVDISFAPVLDLDWQVSEVIGNRAFHADSHVVSQLAGAFMQGMMQAGMPAVGKHFPGHGWVAGDSHTQLPVDDRPFETLWQHDIKPFATLMAKGLAAVMPAHVVYSACDSQPAGFSAFWLQQVLRNQLGFKGIIYSDDLSMAGAEIAGSFLDRAKAALTAGCDRLLICNHRAGVIEVLDQSHHIS